VLYDLEKFGAQVSRLYQVSDVTVVIAVRLHANNPWVLERIAALEGYYEPAPQLLVVDLGSAPPYREQVAEACARAGAELIFVPDDGVFCLAMARNAGAAHARTELLFFSDVDCFGERDLFQRLIAHANNSGLGEQLDQVVLLPVYHLAAASSATFFAAGDASARSLALGRAMSQSVLTVAGSIAEYVDPHSNFFLIRRDFYDYVGGVNENFRGHGSEDFEFLLRVALYSQQFPLPDRPADDVHSPYLGGARPMVPYRGFRRLFELMAYPAQLAGLRIAHLHHDRGKDTTGWYEQKDWGRRRFSEQVLPILEARANLLAYDWMPRSKRALVLIKQDAHADVFFPLRLAGYQLLPAVADDAASLERALTLVQTKAVDAVTVFNPYMHSHTALKPLFDAALDAGVRTIVFERGALPESWYYGPDMSYADGEYASVEPRPEDFTADELALVDDYIARLRSGFDTLESNGEYAATAERYAALRARHDKICLVPLQLDDDVAVTRFAEGYPAYTQFLRDLPTVAAQHPDVTFLVKTHPLSKRTFKVQSANVVVCDRADNIHALIDTADAVIAYNSGVGLLALIHQKKLVTLGNAYYNRPGLGMRAATFHEAVELAFRPGGRFHEASIRLLVAWLVLRKYSFFRSESVIRELTARQTHGYRNMLWYRLNLDGTRATRRAALESRVDAASYAAARLGIAVDLAGLSTRAGEPSTRASSRRRGGVSAKLQKLLRDPKRFLDDSGSKPLRMLGAALPASTLQSVARSLSRLRSKG
jgi:predicted glycosyltransferase involved in capsule biosynthesis